MSGTTQRTQRSAQLAHLDTELNRLWRLGRNVVVGWRRAATGVDVLPVPQYLLPGLLADREDLLDAGTETAARDMRELARIFDMEPQRILVPGAHSPRWCPPGVLADLVRRYSVARLEAKAALLFDMVGFSRHSPLEQVAALNSLSHSINIAHQRAMEHGIRAQLSMTSTGDGFYVWNRKNGLEANLDLFTLLMLILVDNALQRERGRTRTVPLLRTGFHVGNCYEFFQADAEGPHAGRYIVGDATIALARMIGHALPSQILVGNFQMRGGRRRKEVPVDTVAFLELARGRLEVFEDVHLAGERVTSVSCYLTGDIGRGATYAVDRYVITDKHGYAHDVYNAKMNVHRRRGETVYLGLQRSELERFDAELGRGPIAPRALHSVVPIGRA